MFESSAQNLVLNQTNALHLKQLGVYKKYVLDQPLSWHKFIIHGGAELDREKVLKTIVDAAGDIFPIQYSIENKNSCFIARNCNQAIDLLCQRNLILEYPGGQPLILSIMLKKGVPTETTLKIQDVILQVLNKRFTKKTGVLNLENLVKDPVLSDKVYCALSHNKILTFVLSLTRGMGVKCLRLNNNEIKNIDKLEVTGACRTITSVDLRNNMIENMISLIPLKHMSISELWLDGNPVCQNYEEHGYVLAIKEICPNIEKLDGIQLSASGTPAFRRNFLVNLLMQEFVDQFLEHYFTLYDNKDRNSLHGLYHKRALFSLTCSFLPGQITSMEAKLEEYKKLSRNLLTMSDYSKHDKYLIYGGDDVVKTLCKLPPTEHDPYTFTVDLLYYSEVTAVIVVTGVFRKPSINLIEPEQLLGFTRTFVLSAASHGEFNIVNELFHVSNATTIQAQRAFKVVKVPNPIQNPLSYSADEKNCLIETFARITTLNMDYSKRILENAGWKIKNALVTFVDQYKNEKLAPEAFKIV